MKSAAKKIAIPRIAVPTARRATAIVSRWLRSEVSPLLLAGRATYNPVTYCWHIPIQIVGSAGKTRYEIGDAYLQAYTGDLVGRPAPEQLRLRATSLASIYGTADAAKVLE